MSISIPQTTTATKIPELYPENLETLRILTHKLEDLAMVDGVFEIEIRVRIDDVETWAVIGYGEAGDPCVVRFETPPAKPTGPVYRDSGFISTINKLGGDLGEGGKSAQAAGLVKDKDRKCSCGDYCYGNNWACGPNGCYNVPG